MARYAAVLMITSQLRLDDELALMLCAVLNSVRLGDHRDIRVLPSVGFVAGENADYSLSKNYCGNWPSSRKNVNAPNSQQLYEAVQSFWHCYSKEPLVCLDERSRLPMELRLLWFACDTAGSDCRAVLMGIDPLLAEQLASDMFGRSTATVSDEDVRDAIGEITNIIAGLVNNLEKLQVRRQLPIKLHEDHIVKRFSKLKVLADVMMESSGRICYLAVADGELGLGGPN